MNFKAVLLAGLIAAPLPVFAQQTNVYQTCTNYQESYTPGYYDKNGNYVQGRVYTQQYNVSCGTGTYYRPNSGPAYQTPTQPQRSCSAARTTLGGLLGGGIAAALSKSDAYGWSIPLGAVLGLGAAQAGCY